MSEPTIGQPYPLVNHPYQASGGHCVACDRMLGPKEQAIKGYASGLELGLCSSCAAFVNVQSKSGLEADGYIWDGVIGVQPDNYDAPQELHLEVTDQDVPL